MCPNIENHTVVSYNLYVVNKVAAARAARHSVGLQRIQSWVGTHKSDLPLCLNFVFAYQGQNLKEYQGNSFHFQTRITSLPFADDARFKDGLHPSREIIFRGWRRE